MERERLNHLMQDPSRVAKEDLAGLEELTTRYPWFSAAHLLLAVGEHTAGDVLYDERAHTAAAHLPVRSVLFDLVHQEPVIAPSHPPVVEPPMVPTWIAKPVELDPAPTLPIPGPGTAVLMPPAAPLPAQAVELAALVVDTPVLPAVLPAPPAPVAEIPVAPWPVVEPGPEVPAAPVWNAVPIEATPLPPLEVEAAPPEVDPLDALIRQAAFAGTYELLLEHEVAAAPAPTEVPPAPEAEVERTMAAAQVVPAPVVPTSLTGKLRFLDWLEQAEHPEAAPAQSAGPAPTDWIRSAEPPADVPAPVKPLKLLPELPSPTEAPESKPKGGMSVLDATSLIDSFIRQEHPEPPKRTEFFNPQTAAKRSLEEHKELVTETLAKIYEKQGNTAKALAAYRKLAERHPERKDHFLGLAKALEGKGKA